MTTPYNDSHEVDHLRSLRRDFPVESSLFTQDALKTIHATRYDSLDGDAFVQILACMSADAVLIVFSAFSRKYTTFSSQALSATLIHTDNTLILDRGLFTSDQRRNSSDTLREISVRVCKMPRLA
ncbi:MAG TPA: hypothetical protein ENJ30_01715 [Desulfobulbaceae bacterium]|nr:hypothetical protein [Desulfobulbaceae bacterium]